jgi:hypothetical protein
MTAAAKKQTKAEPQRAASTAQAPQAPKPAVPTPANRQTATFDKLKAAWEARGVSTEKIELKPDGKFLNVIVGEGWPLIVIGASGGITLPTIRSYATAFEAAVNGDKLLAKQNERDQKKNCSVSTASDRNGETSACTTGETGINCGAKGERAPQSRISHGVVSRRPHRIQVRFSRLGFFALPQSPVSF